MTRKLILCALGMSNPQRAREIYLEMSETNKQHPSSQYLVYKVALRCQSTGLGTNPTAPLIQRLNLQHYSNRVSRQYMHGFD